MELFYFFFQKFRILFIYIFLRKFKSINIFIFFILIFFKHYFLLKVEDNKNEDDKG